MQKVKLIGNISKFGENWETSCTNIRDIFKLIECQTPGFRQHLVDAAEAGVGYEIRRGKDFLESEEELLLSLNNEDIIITEVPAGAKSAGAKILAAIVLFVIAGPMGPQLLGTGALATAAVSIATSLAIQGVSQLLAPGPETDKKQNEGYLFDGPINTVQQGMPVPVCYGELRIGGAPIGVSFRGMGSSGSGVGTGTHDPGTKNLFYSLK